MRLAFLFIVISCLFSTSSISAVEPDGTGVSRILVSWEQGQITQEQFMAYKKFIKRSYVKEISESEVRETLREMATDDFLSQRASAEKFSYERKLLEIEEARVRRELLTEMFVSEEIVKKTTVTDAEVARRLGKFTPKYVIRVFRSFDRAKADFAHYLLRSGKRFEDVVRVHSDNLNREGGGQFGDIEDSRRQPFTEEQYRRITRLKNGEFTEVFEMPTGWTIVLMERVFTSEEQRKEAVGKYRDTVKLSKEREAYWKRLSSLQKRAVIKWEDKAIAKVFSLAREGKMDSLPAKVAGMPLARVNGKPIYAGEMALRMSGLHSENDLEKFLGRRVDDELIMQEAARLGYERRIAVQLGVVRKHWIARTYLKGKTRDLRKVTEEDLKRYYLDNPERFRSPEKRALQIIQVGSRKKADAAQEEIRRGRSFDDLAAEYNESPETARAKGYAGFLSANQISQDVRNPIFALRKGEISKTMESRSGSGGKIYVIVRVLDIRPAGIIPYERINRRVIEDRIVSSRNEMVLETLLADRPRLQWSEETIKRIATGG
jgi:hypothetical protein